MKIDRHLVSFALGVAVGIRLYSLPGFQSLFRMPTLNIPSRACAKYPDKSLRSTLVQRPLLAHVGVPERAPSEKRVRAVTRKAPEGRARVHRQPDTVNIAEAAVRKEVAAVNLASAPPPLTTFKPIGYVEQAEGQSEAIILQENELQVVHIHDLIAGRYRVTKIAPDSVEATDETLVQSPMAKPNEPESRELTASSVHEPSTPSVAVAQVQPQIEAAAAKSDHPSNAQGGGPVGFAPAFVAKSPTPDPPRAVGEDRFAAPQSEKAISNSLGYVQKADGKVETIVADGDTVRLVPETAGLAEVGSPGVSLEGVPSVQALTLPIASLSSNKQVMAESSSHPDGVSALPPGLVIRQASYQGLLPAQGPAEGPAPRTGGSGADGKANGAMSASIESTASNFLENPAGSTDGPARLPILMKPLGFVVKEDGQFAAILSDDHDLYIVRQGDRFAGRYRALSVSADAVEAVEEPPPRQAHPPPLTAPLGFPDTVSATRQYGAPLYSVENCLDSESKEWGEVSAKSPDATLGGVRSPPVSTHGQVAPPTYVFQALGYIETEDGEMRAVVADGSDLYLVREGETFADKYRATSVDTAMVLAVKVSSEQDAGNFLSAQTESGGQAASKKLYGYFHFPLSELASLQVLHTRGPWAGPDSIDLGLNLLNSSLVGFDLQSHISIASKPNFAF